MCLYIYIYAYIHVHIDVVYCNEAEYQGPHMETGRAQPWALEAVSYMIGWEDLDPRDAAGWRVASAVLHHRFPIRCPHQHPPF